MSYVHSLIGSTISNAFAIINVTYPVGSVCICTKGTKVLTASDTSGSYVFPIPEAGSWTVRCWDGASYESSDSKASETVNITEQYQVVNVTLNYGTRLYYHGNQYSEVTGGWTQSGYSYYNYPNPAGLTFGTESFTLSRTVNIPTVGTNNRINFTGYSTLYVEVKNCSVNHTISLSSNKNIDSTNVVAEHVVDSVGLHAIDVSRINTSYYLSVELNSAKGFTEISKIYLI